jgi:RNA polymerase sigma-70 factor (ECF subfamily)
MQEGICLLRKKKKLLQKNATFSGLATNTKCRGSQKEAHMTETSRMINNILSIQDYENTSSISESQLVCEYSSILYKYCVRLTFRKEDADDLFQDTYVRAFAEIEKIRLSENPQSFLLSIATSLWKSHKRKYARRNRLAPIVDIDEVDFGVSVNLEDDVIASEEVYTIRELVNGLPDKLKITVVMFYTVEMSIAEIAETLRLPIGTVKSHLSRARGIIRKGLDNEYEKQ